MQDRETVTQAEFTVEINNCINFLLAVVTSCINFFCFVGRGDSPVIAERDKVEFSIAEDSFRLWRTLPINCVHSTLSTICYSKVAT